MVILCHKTSFYDPEQAVVIILFLLGACLCHMCHVPQKTLAQPLSLSLSLSQTWFQDFFFQISLCLKTFLKEEK